MQGGEVVIRLARASDMEDVLAVERAAFGSDEEPDLVRDLLSDNSASPVLSLMALIGERPVGHILFTGVCLEPKTSEKLSILAPLAVVPDCQRRGIGGKLVARGLDTLKESGTGLVFVLGHTEYYPRHGFHPAGELGFAAPFPIPEKNSEAWMVRELRHGIVGRTRGKVVCADTLNKPHYWRE